ncbi:metal-sensitive transcriptional regulator [Desulforudis sp. 1088]|uniref:metal-sensitive transcriptional regulator n=1 Tax=unclassified Candidatus Desulforudis TaxID=2635950 RepID=UPI00346B5C0E
MPNLDPDSATKIINRLKRIEGQARGIQRMIAEGQDCKLVVGQLNALRAAVQNATKTLIGEYLECCVKAELARGGDCREAIKKTMDLLLGSK